MEDKKKEIQKKTLKSKLFFSGTIFIGIIPFMFVVYLLLGPVIKVIHKDYTGEKMYIISEKLKIRSEKGKDAYIIGDYPFGTEVKVYEVFENEWAEVSVKNKKGFMSLEFLVTPEIFYLIEGMYGDDNAKKYVTKTVYRKAISTYLSDNNYTTNIPKEIKEELYGTENQKEVWQLYAEKGNAKYNTFSYGDYNGDKVQDAAFILKNINNGKRKLIVLDLNVDIPDKYSKLLYSEEIENDWTFIKNADKGYKYIINGEKGKIEIDGIILGSLREKSFNDTEQLLLYNGQKFEKHKQEEIVVEEN